MFSIPDSSWFESCLLSKNLWTSIYFGQSNYILRQSEYFNFDNKPETFLSTGIEPLVDPRTRTSLVPPPGPISFIFIQFSAKKPQMIHCHTHLGNPISAIGWIAWVAFATVKKWAWDQKTRGGRLQYFSIYLFFTWNQNAITSSSAFNPNSVKYFRFRCGILWKV